jgi:hypothetical protein
MAEVLDPPRWQAVGLVIDQNQRDFLAGRYSLAEDLLAWFKAVDLFRDTQDERMILREPTSDDLRQHKTWVASLIAEGERLVMEALARGGLPEGAARFKLPRPDTMQTVSQRRLQTSQSLEAPNSWTALFPHDAFAYHPHFVG